MCCFDQILVAAHHQTTAVQLSASHLTNHSSKTRGTNWRREKKLKTMFSDGLLFMDVPVLVDQQHFTDIISVQI